MSIWVSGSPYEAYVGRRSRLVAPEFLAWLAVPSSSRWLDLAPRGPPVQGVYRGGAGREEG